MGHSLFIHRQDLDECCTGGCVLKKGNQQPLQVLSMRARLIKGNDELINTDIVKSE